MCVILNKKIVKIAQRNPQCLWRLGATTPDSRIGSSLQIPWSALITWHKEKDGTN